MLLASTVQEERVVLILLQDGTARDQHVHQQPQESPSDDVEESCRQSNCTRANLIGLFRVSTWCHVCILAFNAAQSILCTCSWFGLHFFCQDPVTKR